MMTNSHTYHRYHPSSARRKSLAYSSINLFPDLLISIAIIATCIALIVPQFTILLEKTRLANVLALFQPKAEKIVINFAFSGDILQIPHEDIPFSFYRDVETPPHDNEKYPYKISNGIFYSTGVTGRGEDYFITVSPAITEHDVPWNIIWTCGKRQPPSGWVTPAGLKGTNLKDKYLLSMCQNKTGQRL